MKQSLTEKILINKINNQIDEYLSSYHITDEKTKESIKNRMLYYFNERYGNNKSVFIEESDLNWLEKLFGRNYNKL